MSTTNNQQGRQPGSSTNLAVVLKDANEDPDKQGRLFCQLKGVQEFQNPEVEGMWMRIQENNPALMGTIEHNSAYGYYPGCTVEVSGDSTDNGGSTFYVMRRIAGNNLEQSNDKSDQPNTPDAKEKEARFNITSQMSGTGSHTIT